MSKEYMRTASSDLLQGLVDLGIEYLFLSNASGGVNPAFEIGELMILNDHINLFPTNPLIGKNIDELGVEYEKLDSVRRERGEVMKIVENEMVKLEKNLSSYKATSPNIHKLLTKEISVFPAFSKESFSSTLSQVQTFRAEFENAFRNYIGRLVYISNAKSKISCSRNGGKKIVEDINPICPTGYKKR